MSVEFLTGVGRIVWGHPLKAQKKKHLQGALKGQPVIRDGKEVEQWVFGVAFPKAEFNALVWPFLAQEAATGYPNGVPPRFSWKIKDGDGVDNNGKPYSLREGYAGCFVLTVSTEAFAPSVWKLENNAYRQLQAHELKTGDYVALKIAAKVNVPTDTTMTPGLYINPQGIELVGYGQEIVSTENPDEMFGKRQYQLPPGATATPQAPVGGIAMPGAPAAPAAYPPQGAHHAPAAPPAYVPPAAPAPVAYPPPAHDFVNNAIGAPAAPVGYTPPGAPAAPVGYTPPGAPAAPVGYTPPGAPAAPVGYTPPGAPAAPAAPQGYPAHPGIPQGR